MIKTPTLKLKPRLLIASLFVCLWGMPPYHILIVFSVGLLMTYIDIKHKELDGK